MKRAEIAAMGALKRKELLDDVMALLHSGEWRWGEAVRFLREVVLGRSRPQFAKLVGVSVAALQQLEDWPDANPTIDTLHRVLRPFGGTVGLRFPRMEQPDAPTVEVEARHRDLKAALLATKRRVARR